MRQDVRRTRRVVTSDLDCKSSLLGSFGPAHAFQLYSQAERGRSAIFSETVF